MMEEEVFMERALGDRGGGVVQPVQDEGMRDEFVPNASYTAYTQAPQQAGPGENFISTSRTVFGKVVPTPQQEGFFGINARKNALPDQTGQLGFKVPVHKVAAAVEPPAPPTVALHSPMEEGCLSTSFKDLSVNVRYPDLSKAKIIPESVLYDNYQAGLVLPGSGKAVRCLVEDVKQLSLCGTTGIITDTVACRTQNNQYEEGKDFSVNRNLGQGMSGTVDLCTDQVSKQLFVRKRITDFAAFPRREVDVLRMLNHKNIARFKGFILRNGNPEIFQENAGIALHKMVNDPCKFRLLNQDDNVARLARQGLEALDYLDMRGILHLDVKPENFCISEEPQLELKLTDFGSCKTAMDPLRFCGWTPEYMSPEACYLYVTMNKNEQACPPDALTSKTDVYAFGATIAFIRHRVNPLTAYFIQNKTKEQYMKEERVKIILKMAQCPGFMSALARQIPTLTPNERLLLAKLLAGNPQERCSAKEALDFVRGTMLPELGLEPPPPPPPPPTPQQLPHPLQQPQQLPQPLQQSQQLPQHVCAESMSPQPPSPAESETIEEEPEEGLEEEDLEIDVRGGKAYVRRGPAQMATPEAAMAGSKEGDPMSQMAGRTGQAVVLNETQAATFGHYAQAGIDVSPSSQPKEHLVATVPMTSPAVPATIQLGGSFGVTACNNQTPAGAGLAAPRGLAGKGVSMARAPPQLLHSKGKTMLRRHLMQRQKSHPYRSDKFVSSPELPAFNQLM